MTSEGFTFSFLRERYLKHLRKPHLGIAISLVWAHSRDGQVSFKVAYSQMVRDSPQNRLPTKDRLYMVGFYLASSCSVYGVSSESADHLFLQCPLAVALWEAVFFTFQRRISAD
ncbi:hypothetical protein Dsin_032507 [Dipteronia sinensis]|uniref:Reverse transcriptase zinc-binding domain-containing protein n=1 Tax=Dipteronia sinensis TaxID=43782 RepID=A0AAD9Z659_9ROSI|nr:hypothetical protein Dsin_032507 [Dipteronia sinensis]